MDEHEWGQSLAKPAKYTNKVYTSDSGQEVNRSGHACKLSMLEVGSLSIRGY